MKPDQFKYTKAQKEILLNFGKLLTETPYEGNADPLTGLNYYCTLLVAHLRTRALGVIISMKDYGYMKDQPEARAKLNEGMRYIEMSNSERYPHLPGKRIRLLKDEFGNPEYEIDSTIKLERNENWKN